MRAASFGIRTVIPTAAQDKQRSCSQSRLQLINAFIALTSLLFSSSQTKQAVAELCGAKDDKVG
jgi:hypothetical protein